MSRSFDTSRGISPARAGRTGLLGLGACALVVEWLSEVMAQ